MNKRTWFLFAAVVLIGSTTQTAQARCVEREDRPAAGFATQRSCSVGASEAVFGFGDVIDQNGEILRQFVSVMCDNDNCTGTAAIGGYDAADKLVCYAETTGVLQSQECPPSLAYARYVAIGNPQ